jgi:hypothetical protein
VRSPREKERRRSKRFALQENLPEASLSPLGPSRARTRIRAQVHDVSSGGVSLSAPRSIAEAQLVRCELHVPGLPAPIPTLLQVRWTRRSAQGHRMGLQYVI